MDQLKILEILEKNKDKDFVNRILNAADFPTLSNRDGTESTHSMAWSEADGRFFVYPTVVYEEDEMLRLGPDTAFGRAIRSGDFIEFDNFEEADEFSREYKKVNPFFEKSDEAPEVVYPKRKTIWKDLNAGRVRYPTTIRHHRLAADDIAIKFRPIRGRISRIGLFYCEGVF